MESYRQKKFDYIISLTAKDRELTSQGISEINPTGSTLDDLLREIEGILGFEELKELPKKERINSVKTLLEGTSLLIFIDNLETVSDNELITFIEELPSPTKALITSRKIELNAVHSPSP